MNLSKVLKQKRDAEDRLRRNSPQPVFIGGGGDGGSDTYISNTQIIKNFNTVSNEITNITNNIGSLVPYREPLVSNFEILFSPNGDILMGEVI